MGYHPYCAAITQDDKTLYVTNTQDDNVTVIDLVSKKVITTVNVGSTPEGISIDHLHHRAYVANWGSNNVSVIDTTSNKLVATIKTGDKSRAFGLFTLNHN